MTIFVDEADYGVFLSYLKEYLSPPPDKDKLLYTVYLKDRVFKGVDRIPKNFTNKLVLVCYCLMPNHFHLLIKQHEKGSMKDFIHSLLLRYSMYFNKKYKRVGPVFQGRFKAILIENENYLLHLSRYIHLNPGEYTDDLINAKSSYADFLRLRHTAWINAEIILSFFNKSTLPEFDKPGGYKKFVDGARESIKILEGLTLD